MYYLKSEQSFDAAHFLADYEGKCRNLHGHRWRVVAEVKGDRLAQDPQHRGMLIDFGELKQLLKDLCDHMDHCLIYETGSMKETTVRAMREENFRMIELPFRPTAENFAKYFFDRLRENGLAVHRIEVYETPGNCAIYEET